MITGGVDIVKHHRTILQSADHLISCKPHLFLKEFIVCFQMDHIGFKSLHGKRNLVVDSRLRVDAQVGIFVLTVYMLACGIVVAVATGCKSKQQCNSKQVKYISSHDRFHINDLNKQ